MRAAILLVLLAACFDPSYAPGLPCSERGNCPPDQTCGSDGVCRLAHPPGVDAGTADAVVDAFDVDAAVADADVVDAAPPPDGAPDAMPTLHSIGGTIAGLAGRGLVLRNGDEAIMIELGDERFTFPGRVPHGSAYSVTVSDHPTARWQTCVVAGGAGIVDRDVTDIAITCTTNQYAVGGTVTGLAPDNTIVLSLEKQTVVRDRDGSFAFAEPVPSGQRVSVRASIEGPIAQDCGVLGNDVVVGGADVRVEVRCTTRRFAVLAQVTGLVSGTLRLLNGADRLDVTENGTFAFPTRVPSGARYDVTIFQPPAGHGCAVTGGSGVVESGDLTVAVQCAPCGNLVPPMTSATTPSGRVDRSGIIDDDRYDAWHAFDDSAGGLWISEQGIAPAWISYAWDDGPRTATRYAITFANGTLTSRAPRDWTLEGLSGSTWVEVDRRSGETDWANERREYTVASPGSYPAYRLNITEDNDDRQPIVAISIGRIELIGSGCPVTPAP